MLECPLSFVIELVKEADSYDVDFNCLRSQVNASDPSGEVTVSFLPEKATIRTGNYENVTVVAVDRAGNQARCHFQVSIKPQPCVDWELKKPAYGDINCIPRGLGTSLDGYECIATCETGFRLVFFFSFYHQVKDN